MFTFKHKNLIIIAGLVWLSAGVFLLQLGLRLLTSALSFDAEASILFHKLSRLLGSFENAVIGLIVVGLMIGFYKGRMILSKSVSRIVNRIKSLEEPAQIYKMYSLPYVILLLSMICLGMAIKYFQVPVDIRGTIDVAIGSALINGSMLYFRQAL